MRTSPSRVPLRAGLVVVLLLAAGGGAYAASRGDCVVGVKGTAATVTVQGLDAASWCDQRTAGASAQRWELRGQAPGNPVVCSFDSKGTAFGFLAVTRRSVVRDDPKPNAITATLCSNLPDD